MNPVFYGDCYDCIPVCASDLLSGFQHWRRKAETQRDAQHMKFMLLRPPTHVESKADTNILNKSTAVAGEEFSQLDTEEHTDFVVRSSDVVVEGCPKPDTEVHTDLVGNRDDIAIDRCLQFTTERTATIDSAWESNEDIADGCLLEAVACGDDKGGAQTHQMLESSQHEPDCDERMTSTCCSGEECTQIEEASWIDMGAWTSDFDVYVKDFCGSLGIPAALELVSKGKCVLNILLSSGDSAYEPIPNPAYDMSSIIWTLMYRALQCNQGFAEGTFVLYGPRVARILEAFSPHLYPRVSSHFKGRSVGQQYGIDILPDGSQDLPARKQHVLLGLIRMKAHDGSIGVFIKPEQHGCDVFSSPTETVKHGMSWASSQVHRQFGDRRAHDEGEFKRKERVPVTDQELFNEHLKELQTILKETQEPEYGLAHMAQIVRKLSAHGAKGNQLLEEWEECYGATTLDFRTGREVLIHTSELANS